MTMINERSRLILNCLSYEKESTITYLCNVTGVSYKTIQSDIYDLNALFKQMNKDIEIISNKNTGIHLSFSREEDLIDVFKTINQLCHDNNTKLRNQFIIDLLKDRYVKVDELADKYFISKSSISEKLKEVKSFVKSYEVNLETRTHYGMKLLGSEKNIRKLLVGILYPLNMNEQSILLEDNSEEIADLYERAIAKIKDYQFPIDDYSLEQLLLYLRIVKYRCFQGNYSLEEAEMSSIRDRKLVENLTGLIGMEDYKENEEYALYSMLIGMKKYVDTRDIAKNVNQSDVEECIKEIVELVNRLYGYDFSKNIELFTSLTLHLAGLVERGRNDYYAFNPILEDIKMLYPLPFDMGIDAANVINRMFNIKLNENEVGYIAIYLHLAVETSQQKIKPKRVLAVCPVGRGMSELVKHYIEKRFGENIEEIDCCSYRDLEHIDVNKYDYAFTIDGLSINVPIPVVHLSLNGQNDEVNKIQKQLRSNKGIGLLDLAREELFFTKIKAKNKQEVLKKIIEKVSKEIKLDENFYELVMERESKFSTELDNYCAFPHPMTDDAAERSFLSVSILEKPILWNKKKVRIVLLAFIRKGESKLLRRFYDEFSSFVSTKEYCLSLLDKQTYQELIEIVERMERG